MRPTNTVEYTLSPRPRVARSIDEAWPLSTVSTTANAIPANWPMRIGRVSPTMPRTIDARSIVRDYNAVNLFVFVPVSAIRWGVLKAPRAVLMLVLLAMIPSIPPALAAEIEPDRPEVTESARLVPREAVQLESGLAFSSERRAGLATEKIFEVDANLRMGVSIRRAESRLGAAGPRARPR
jgi:hypothetical protein